MKKHNPRARRVADQIQRELADLLTNALKDPRVGRITVTQVDVGADLAHATVYFSHLAGKEQAPDVTAALGGAAGFLRSELSRRLDLYSVPRLRFVYDDSVESGMRLSSLIDQAVAEDKKHPHE